MLCIGFMRECHACSNACMEGVSMTWIWMPVDAVDLNFDHSGQKCKSLYSWLLDSLCCTLEQHLGEGGLSWRVLLVFPSFEWGVLPAREPRQACSNCSSSTASPRLEIGPARRAGNSRRHQHREPNGHRDSGNQVSRERSDFLLRGDFKCRLCAAKLSARTIAVW